jgi:tripartite-type tricarboxylate transporter receptor subunit TctC
LSRTRRAAGFTGTGASSVSVGERHGQLLFKTIGAISGDYRPMRAMKYCQDQASPKQEYVMFTKIIKAAALVLVAFSTAGASAQSFPSKPVKIVVATTAGGQTDVYTRALATELSKVWGQPVIIENKPGASTIIGSIYVAQSPADGYTILVANDPTLSSNQYLHSKLGYDPVKDFAPVINMVETIQIMVAEPSFPAQTLSQLVAMAKAKPGVINYGTFGNGSKTHLDTEAFAQVAGIKLAHIPYKGVSDVMVALLGKQIDIALSGISAAQPHIRSGKLKALAIAGPTRSPLLPSVPTFAEAGVPGFESRSWFGLVVPTGTPRAVIDKIAQDTSTIINRPDFLEKHIIGNGYSLLNQGPDQYEAFLKKDRAEYAARIKNINLKPQ